MKPRKINAQITAKKQLASDVFCLELKTPGLHLQPGNFFQVNTSETYDPYLNRPISVAGYKRSYLLLIIREVGRGTQLLSRKKIGERVLLLGPMGKGISPKKKRALLIAGGIGIAPLYFLAQYLSAKKTWFSLIYGVRNNGDHVMRSELKKMCPELFFVCERGAKKSMTALDVLGDLELAKYDVVYACGPRTMLIELQGMKIDRPAYVFCEDFLGCGCGICLGCAIKINRVYKRICVDGPVFELNDIDFR